MDQHIRALSMSELDLGFSSACPLATGAVAAVDINDHVVKEQAGLTSNGISLMCACSMETKKCHDGFHDFSANVESGIPRFRGTVS